MQEYNTAAAGGFPQCFSLEASTVPTMPFYNMQQPEKKVRLETGEATAAALDAMGFLNSFIARRKSKYAHRYHLSSIQPSSLHDPAIDIALLHT